MEWRKPADDFARLLEAARGAVLAHADDPPLAVAPFEPILEPLYDHASSRGEKLPRVRSFGRELFGALRSRGRPIAMEVRHYCWHLQFVDEPGGSSLKDMLMTTLTRFAHYDGHEVDRCPVCAEFRDDSPFRGSPGGRAHFRDWLRRRAGTADS